MGVVAHSQSSRGTIETRVDDPHAQYECAVEYVRLEHTYGVCSQYISKHRCHTLAHYRPIPVAVPVLTSTATSPPAGEAPLGVTPVTSGPATPVAASPPRENPCLMSQQHWQPWPQRSPEVEEAPE